MRGEKSDYIEVQHFILQASLLITPDHLYRTQFMLSMRLVKVTIHLTLFPEIWKRCQFLNSSYFFSCLSCFSPSTLHQTWLLHHFQPLFSHLLPTVLCDLCKSPRKVLLTKTNCLHLLPRKLPQCFKQLSKKALFFNK